MAAGIVFPVNWMMEPQAMLRLLKEADAKAVIALGPTPGFRIWQSLMAIAGNLPAGTQIWSVAGPDGDVTGPQPDAIDQGPSCDFGLLPVALEYLGTVHDDLAHLVRLQLGEILEVDDAGIGVEDRDARALALRAEAEHAAGRPFKVRVLSGASTGKSVDGALATADAISFRAPYQANSILRKKINAGEVHFVDMHLSMLPQQVRYGFFGETGP